MFTRILFIVCVLLMLTGMSCSTQLRKIDLEYRENMSGSIRARILTKGEELERLRKEAQACGARLQETEGTFPDDKKQFIVEFSFATLKQLERSVDCSKMVQETIAFQPIKVSENFLSRETTFSITLSDYKHPSGLFGPSTKLPPEIVITTPSKIIEASVTETNSPVQDYYTLRHEIVGQNTAKFSISSDSGVFDLDLGEDELKRKCGNPQSEAERNDLKYTICFAGVLDKTKSCKTPSGTAALDKAAVETYMGCAFEINSKRSFISKFGKKYGASCGRSSDATFVKCAEKNRDAVYESEGGVPKFTINVKTKVSKLFN